MITLEAAAGIRAGQSVWLDKNGDATPLSSAAKFVCSAAHAPGQWCPDCGQMTPAGQGNVLTAEGLRTAMLSLKSPSAVGHGWRTIIHPTLAREIDWYLHRPLLRAAYRKASYPFGRNQGSFKRWALLNGRYPNVRG